MGILSDIMFLTKYTNFSFSTLKYNIINYKDIITTSQLGIYIGHEEIPIDYTKAYKKEYKEFYEELTKKAQLIIKSVNFSVFQNGYNVDNIISNFSKPFSFKVLVNDYELELKDYYNFTNNLPKVLNADNLKKRFDWYKTLINNINTLSKNIFDTYNNCNNIINSLYDSLAKIINFYENFDYECGENQFKTDEKNLLGEYNSIFNNKEANKNLKTELLKLKGLKDKYTKLIKDNKTIFTNGETDLKELENYITLFDTIFNNLNIICNVKGNVLSIFKTNYIKTIRPKNAINKPLRELDKLIREHKTFDDMIIKFKKVETLNCNDKIIQDLSNKYNEIKKINEELKDIPADYKIHDNRLQYIDGNKDLESLITKNKKFKYLVKSDNIHTKLSNILSKQSEIPKVNIYSTGTYRFYNPFMSEFVKDIEENLKPALDKKKLELEEKTNKKNKEDEESGFTEVLEYIKAKRDINLIELNKLVPKSGLKNDRIIKIHDAISILKTGNLDVHMDLVYNGYDGKDKIFRIYTDLDLTLMNSMKKWRY